MKGILFLVRSTFRNQLKEMIRTPGRLIGTIVVVVMLGITLLGGTSSGGGETVLPFEMLTALVTAVYAFLFFVTVRNGLNAGATFYSMADVCLLFSAPIQSRTILFYGLIRQLGMSLLVGFLLIFQYGWLHNVFGLSVDGMILILIGYALTIFCAQLCAMLLYSITAGSDRKRSVAKAIYWAVILLDVAVLAIPAFFSQQPLTLAASNAANSTLSLLIPCAGWISAAVRLYFGETLFLGSVGLVLSIVLIGLLLLIITHMETDFYEDVLRATEAAHSAITAKKEGKVQDVLPQNIKVGKTGLGGPNGAFAFFSKHKLENRRARIFLMDGMSLIMAAITLGFGFFMRDSGGAAAAFAFACYLQLFTTASGRWLRELLLPYVYMVPESSAKKLIAICMEQIRMIILESLIVMIPLGLICKASPLVIIAMVFARIGYGFFYMAGNILIERILGWMVNKTLILLLYFLIMMVLAAPGIALAFLSAALLGGNIAAALLATLLWNLLVTAGVILFCRDMLSYAELNNR
ncbi:MAG: putative ABC exporter domain-containing protein [Candidatus Merdivicinus sp.]|jgi:hypothetical protein